MTENHESFKKKVEDAGTNLSEVSILLPNEYFENNKLKGNVSLKKIMLLGLNRSFPEEYNLDYQNMRDALLEPGLLDNVINNISEAYLSDFCKWKILSKFEINSNLSKAKEVIDAIDKSGKRKEIVTECGDILLREIKIFEISKVFCFGKAVWELISEYFKENKEKEKIIIGNTSFFKINHYSKSNCKGRKNIANQIKNIYKLEEKR
jgi:hypothetical protein